MLLRKTKNVVELSLKGEYKGGDVVEVKV